MIDYFVLFVLGFTEQNEIVIFSYFCWFAKTVTWYLDDLIKNFASLIIIKCYVSTMFEFQHLPFKPFPARHEAHPASGISAKGVCPALLPASTPQPQSAWPFSWNDAIVGIENLAPRWRSSAGGARSARGSGGTRARVRWHTQAAISPWRRGMLADLFALVWNRIV